MPPASAHGATVPKIQPILDRRQRTRRKRMSPNAALDHRRDGERCGYATGKRPSLSDKVIAS